MTPSFIQSQKLPTIDTSQLAFPKPGKKAKKPAKPMATGKNLARIFKDPGYLADIRLCPSVISGMLGVDPAHISFGYLPFGKPGNGMGIKPSDVWVLPLTRKEHAEQHSMGEVAFWQKYYGPNGHILALLLCLGLRQAGNVEKMTALITDFRRLKTCHPNMQT